MSDYQWKKGTQLKSITGEVIIVEHFIAEGGTVEVYAVEYNGQKKVLKWFKKQGINFDSFYNDIRQKVKVGIPDSRFEWPIDITEWENDSFGYIVEIFPKNYYNMSELLRGNVEFTSYEKLLCAAMQLVNTFRKLHNRGYIYGDWDSGNIFLDMDTGEVLITGADYIIIDGQEINVYNNPRYLAPETVLNMRIRNIISDRYSLAVILFMLFCRHHPMEGKKAIVPYMTVDCMLELYGKSPLFIMDPNDKSNAPHPVNQGHVFKSWEVLPDYIQDMFQTAFSQPALKNRKGRPCEIQWLKALARWRGELILCPKCGQELNGGRQVCFCGKRFSSKFVLSDEEYNIMAIPGTHIYGCQVKSDLSDKDLTPIAKILEKRDGSGTVGIKNCSTDRWNGISTKGVRKKVYPEEILPLKEGIRLHIGDRWLEIKDSASITHVLKQPKYAENVIFLVVDTSGSMAGNLISQLNHIVEEILNELYQIDIEAPYLGLRVALLEYNTDCIWWVKKPQKLEDFKFEYFQSGGVSDLGQALHELDIKMCRQQFLSSARFCSLILFFTDGDEPYSLRGWNWKEELKKIKENKWFQRAIKIGIGFGEGTDFEILSEITENKESVFRSVDFHIEILKRIANPVLYS